MVFRRLALSAFVLSAAQLGAAASAQAAAGIGLVPTALIASQLLAQPGCDGTPRPALGQIAAAPTAAMSKASAILGGQLSQLELIARQQQGLAAPELVGAGIAPASPAPECNRFAMPLGGAAKPTPFGLRHSPLGADDYLASKRVAVKRTVFDRDWNRVRAEALPKRLSASLTGAVSGASGEARLAAVNAWANSHIRYVEDRELYGQSDYWAGARTTLKRGAGDCEDLAILKLQLLAAMGVKRDDMFLVVARDLARNSDHAVLVVRQGGRHWLLDNATPELLDASSALEYRPIMSFSGGDKWIHGY
ncbi:MAG: transglutaminase-like cysteine peptidase [Novosphingobium sp.]